MTKPALATAVLVLLLTAPGASAFSVRASSETAGGDTDAAAVAPATAVALPDGSRVPLLQPGEAKPGDNEKRQKKSLLTRHLALRLRPAPISSGTATGRRMGFTDFVFRLPLGSVLDFRTGVRVDYDNRPAQEDWAVDGTPTFGFGLRF